MQTLTYASVEAAVAELTGLLPLLRPKLAVERASAQIQTELIACTLGSEAKALLDTMPTAKQLMPGLITVAEVQKQLGPAGLDDDC